MQFPIPTVGAVCDRAHSQIFGIARGHRPRLQWRSQELHRAKQVDEGVLLLEIPMISFSRISKQYGRQVLFVDASFQLNPGEKVGLVGPNGAGKTTLFRMITGEQDVDEGEVLVPKRLTVGYFRQDIEEMSGRSVLDEAIAGSGRLGDLHHELEHLQQAMSDPAKADEMDRILTRFGDVQEEYEHLGGYALEARTREILHGLGFDDERIDGD